MLAVVAEHVLIVLKLVIRVAFPDSPELLMADARQVRVRVRVRVRISLPRLA